MQNSSIEWTHHTFNPWWGCQRVSPGCEHCYAETLAHRYNFKVWGPAKTTGRREMSDAYWRQPLKWDKDARQAGTRARVFCASMADVFEDHPAVEPWRRQLFTLIGATPQLDWLLLTKRPENILRLTYRAIDPLYSPTGNEAAEPNGLDVATFDELYPNVWLGTSVEDQRRADERIPELLKIPARVRFLSCEPLLGPITLRDEWRYPVFAADDPRYYRANGRGVDWVIVGGESGHGARPMHPDWARSLRDQCHEVGVQFFFKQWGEYWPAGHSIVEGREMVLFGGEPLYRLGKKAAGRLLDGRTWDEVPQ